jgi:hypothetical protein
VTNGRLTRLHPLPNPDDQRTVVMLAGWDLLIGRSAEFDEHLYG